MVHLYLDDSIGEDTQAILEKGVVMTTLQAVPALIQTQKNHAPQKHVSALHKQC